MCVCGILYYSNVNNGTCILIIGEGCQLYEQYGIFSFTLQFIDYCTAENGSSEAPLLRMLAASERLQIGCAERMLGRGGALYSETNKSYYYGILYVQCSLTVD